MALIVMLVLLALVIVYCCWGSCCNFIRRRRRRREGDVSEDSTCASSTGRSGSWRPPVEFGSSTSNHIHEHHHHHHPVPTTDAAVAAAGKSRSRVRPALPSPPPYDLLFGQVFTPGKLVKILEGSYKNLELKSYCSTRNWVILQRTVHWNWETLQRMKCLPSPSRENHRFIRWVLLLSWNLLEPTKNLQWSRFWSGFRPHNCHSRAESSVVTVFRHPSAIPVWQRLRSVITKLSWIRLRRMLFDFVVRLFCDCICDTVDRFNRVDFQVSSLMKSMCNETNYMPLNWCNFVFFWGFFC